MAPILDKLDDFCLQKLFRFLPLADLSNAAAVCKRFKHNAVEIFKLTHTKLDILELIDKDYPKEWYMVRWMTEKFMKSVEQLFKNFGVHIKALRLQGTGNKEEGMDENELLLLVKLYCTALKELTLYDIGREDNFSAKLLPLFASLEKLSVFGIFGDNLSDSFISILSACHDLKYLNVNGVPAPLWINHKFPKLETLDISNDWEFDYNDFESFLKSHENLRTLRYDNTWIISEVFATISKSLVKLQKFCCKFTEMFDYDDEVEEHIIHENILQLSKLKLLKYLTFSCDKLSMKLLVGAFHKENSPIEHLEIVDCEILLVCLNYNL